MTEDTVFMAAAIKLARLGQHQTYKNPLVGAVLVVDDQIIGTGAHLVYGQQHAERQAIASVKDKTQLVKATLYVTLEPCHHTGKQPPCSELIVASGISKVVVAQVDPNPLVAGKGITFLKEHGVAVKTGVLTQEAEALNPFYNFYYRQQRPWITLKQAITLDGKLTQTKGTQTAITNQAVYDYVHRERANYQGILVGSETVLVDNPNLLTTLNLKHPPVRIVLDRRGRTLKQPTLKLFTASDVPVYIFTTQAKSVALPAHCHVFTASQWSIEAVVEKLAALGLQAIYVEGGAAIHQAFLQSGLWEDVITYVAPKIFGQGLTSFTTGTPKSTSETLTIETVTKVGSDLRIHAKKGIACLQA